MATNSTLEGIKQNMKKSSYIIDNSNFDLPKNEDFYTGAVDTSYLEEVDKKIRESEDSDIYKASFYIETPAITELGIHDREGVYFIKAKGNIDQDDISLNRSDGDTLFFSVDSIEDGGTGAKEAIRSSIVGASQSVLGDASNRAGELEFTLRLLGIDAPEIPHYSLNWVDLGSEKTEKITISDAKQRRDVIYTIYPERSDSTTIDIIKIGDSYREYTTIGKRDGGDTRIKFLISEHSTVKSAPQGLKARDLIKKMIDKANGEVYLMIDRTSLNRSNDRYPSRFGGNPLGSGFINHMKVWMDRIFDYNEYRYAGFRQYGQDAYGRFLGTPYVKIKGEDGSDVWINLAKYLIAEVEGIEIFPTFGSTPMHGDNLNFSSSVFKLHTYDYENRKLMDAISSADGFDDRKEVQKEIFKRGFEDLKNWTVTIGDCTLFVPPTSIRSITQSTSERVPLMRAKGSMAKGGFKSERMIEMTVYFNDEKGINGYEYQTTLPNGEEVTYHMNGLRSLISMFKFTPFLPIESSFINEVLDIEAVTLVNLQLSTMPDYPKCMMAVIVLQEFDYRAYMPELPVPTGDEESFVNMFSKTIRFDLMRYYYQQSILKGEELSNIEYNSREFNEFVIDKRTSLSPMKFDSSRKNDIGFYIANEEHLKRLLQIKMEAIRRPDAVIILSDQEKDAAQELARLYDGLVDIMNDDRYRALIDAMNKRKEGESIAIKANKGDYVMPLIGDSFYTIDKSGKEVKSAKDFSKEIDELLNYVETEMKNAAGETISAVRRVRIGNLESKSGRIGIGLELSIRLKEITNREMIKDLRRGASLENDLIIDDVFSSDKIIIPFMIDVERTGTFDPFVAEYDDFQKFSLNVNHPDVRFISYCSDVRVTVDASDENETINEAAARAKQSTDLENVDSLIFDEMFLGDVKVKSLSCAMGNTISRHGVNGTDTYSPQYMGGQDTTIEMSIETVDPYVVAALNNLPRLSSYYAREYRLVMPCWPLRIKSDISGLLGVNEVLLESVDVQTVPGQPGLYHINMRMTSVDRTLRNREALKKVNDFTNSGYAGVEQRGEIGIKNFFDINSVMAKAELYPDLELPTLEELEEKGFNFTRHKLEKNRVYPDPDFYFSYSHVLTSQIYREAILSSFDEALGEYEWEDQVGGKASTKVVNEVGVEITDSNDIAKNTEEIMTNALKFTKEESGEKKRVAQEMIEILNASDITRSWDIASNIRCSFMEEDYLNLIKGEARSEEVSGVTKEDLKTGSNGAWVYDALSRAREASALISSYLESPINIPQEKEKKESGMMPSISTFASSVSIDIQIRDKVQEILKQKEIKEIFEKIEIDGGKKFENIVTSIVIASACAATGEREFTKTKNDISWKPLSKFVALKISGAQDSSGLIYTEDIDEAIKDAVEFGPFRIKMYSQEELQSMTGEKVDKSLISAESGRHASRLSGVNTKYFLIDPYYRKSGVSAVMEYKENCILNTEYSTEAYFRIILFWLKYLIDTNAIPSITLDVMKKTFIDGISGEVVPKGWSYGVESTTENYYDFVKDGAESLDAGKFFAAASLALTSNDKGISEPIKKRKYEMLNGIVQTCISPGYNYDPKDKTYVYMRKMILALAGLGAIKKLEDIGTGIKNPVIDNEKILHEQKYIEAAEDPRIYVQHSFYDMVCNDKRGRMVRAFPAFYMLLVDAGREFGLWKLHDNFYTVNAISEISIVKSRKIAADVANITMANMYSTFTTEDEDTNPNYNYNVWDVFDSVFNPRAFFIREQAKRLKNQPIERARLTSGTRIHLRLGYGSNAATLPTAFNGVIAEVGAGEVVEIIAQGDGIELVNPILDKTEAHEMKNKDNDPFSKFFKNLVKSGASPKVIIDSLLTTKGGFARRKIREWSNGYYGADHPLGITHFGSQDYNVVFKNGEIVQNIYEAMSTPKWADEDMGAEHNTKEVPKISIDMFGKSFWDVLHICKSATPDFIVGIAPFGLRSTIFHGAPRYYYAYDYFKDENGLVKEKRKPYQQYHIYSSYTDIIKNDIVASERDVKTCAVGLYRRRGAGGKESQERVGPLWVDFEIYPENQKTMTVDTQLYGKGVPVAGSIIPKLNTIIDNTADEEGAVQSAKALAWKMTANALKESIMDMYQGELLVVGDPSVKPHDRMYIHDAYENMAGSCLVEGVVHNLSVSTGFTTSITPDCIATVDDRNEMAIQTLGGSVAAKGSAMTLGVIGGTYALSKGATVTPMTKTTLDLTRKAAVKVARFAGKTNLTWVRSGARALASGAKSAGAVAKVGGLAAGATVGAPVALVAAGVLALEVGVVYTTTKFVYSNVDRWIKSKQVLQVFPLKKNQRVLTAGLNGSKGLVYGSPTYNDSGTLRGMFGKLLDKDSQDGFFGKTVSTIANLIASDDIRATVEKQKRDQGLESDPTNAAGFEKVAEDMLKTMASGQAIKLNGYKRHLMTSRAKSNKELKSSYDKFAATEADSIEVSSKVSKENSFISNDDYIKESIDSGYFAIVHEQDDLEASLYEEKVFDVRGVQTKTRALVSSGGDIYDVPFLKQESIDLLKEIIKECREAFDALEDDSMSSSQNLLILNSALKVGDKSMASTGYSFSLQIEGKGKNDLLEGILSKIQKDIEEMHNSYKITEKRYFEYKMEKQNMARVTIIPPAPGSSEKGEE